MAATESPRTTIADIAQAAGVSAPTVSKVLNGRQGVSSATRERVTELLREHGYAPRRSGGRLTGVIELVLSELDSPWSASLIQAMEAAVYAEGLALVLSRLRPGKADEWLDHIASRNPDGVVFGVVETTAEQRDRLRELMVPFVVIDPEGNQKARVPTVGLTHWRGAHAATEHLVTLGHRRIATIGGPLRLLCSRARADGFRAAAAAAGLDVPPEFVVHTEFGYEPGRDAAAGLLALPTPPTAIFAASDEQALGVYEAARRKGLRVPDDVSVVGFNDAPIASWASPPLTTVREPIEDVAGQAVLLLGRLMAGRTAGPGVELATELVVRESTAAPSTGRRRTQ
ncbi:LacI family DNA-binding transcriptional regulator [Streptomyces iranensis]|uniref:LacI family DNA-binding transcriptional regulator n=1 Tax=Streptomyces iranensis TaxID=576784 RepID=UPI0039B79478